MVTVTGAENPLIGAAVIVTACPDPPGIRAIDDGAAAKEKSPGEAAPETVAATVVE
jgi:hypothetical protein